MRRRTPFGVCPYTFQMKIFMQKQSKDHARAPFVSAARVRVGYVLSFANPPSLVKVEAITRREVDGSIGLHANDDTWVSFYRPYERLRIV